MNSDSTPRSSRSMIRNLKTFFSKSDIRTFAFEHINEVEKIEQTCFSSPWSKKSLLELLSNPLAVFYVALEEGKVVGYVGMYHILSEGQITNIAVLPEYRRKGIASALFDRLLAYAEEEEMDTLTLEVRESNEAAKKFYDKYGFEEVGIRTNYYTAPMEDALLMTKIV